MKLRRKPALPQKASLNVKRSVKVAGRDTSVFLEGAFWNALKEIAAAEKISVPHLVLRIDNERQHGNLSSAIRLYVLDYYRRLA